MTETTETNARGGSATGPFPRSLNKKTTFAVNLEKNNVWKDETSFEKTLILVLVFGGALLNA